MILLMALVYRGVRKGLLESILKIEYQLYRYVNPAVGKRSTARREIRHDAQMQSEKYLLKDRDSFPRAMKRRRIMILPSSHS